MDEEIFNSQENDEITELEDIEVVSDSVGDSPSHSAESDSPSHLERDSRSQSEIDSPSQSESDSVSLIAAVKKTKKKTKKKRRKAGELSGRQMALKRFNKEGDEMWDCHFPPPFGWAVRQMRKVLLEFADGADINAETASAMRIYSTRKLGFNTSDGGTSVLTNYFKVAVLPAALYKMALEVIKQYDVGELSPPPDSTQRQRREVSSSSFNFLRGLNPLKEEDLPKIAVYLQQWKSSAIRPGHVAEKGSTTAKKSETDLKKELERIKYELKEEKTGLSRKLKEITMLEKKLEEAEKSIRSLKKKCDCLEKQHQGNVKIVDFFKDENKKLKEELKEKEMLLLRVDKRTVSQKEASDSSSPNAIKRAHDAQVEELNSLRKKSKDQNEPRPVAADKSKKAPASKSKDQNEPRPVAADKSKKAPASVVADAGKKGPSNDTPIDRLHVNNFEAADALKNHKGSNIIVADKVAVAYDNRFFVGEIIKIENKNVHINFMAKTKGGYYIWPKRRDQEIVGVEFIFYTNIVLVGQGSNVGGYIENEDDILDEFEKYKNDFMS